MNDKAWTMLSSEEQKESKREKQKKLSKEERNVICTKHTHTHTQETPTTGPTV